MVCLQIIARVAVSPLPVHIYVVNPAREIWTHSDTDGTFDVIAVADIAAGDVTTLSATNVAVSPTWHWPKMPCASTCNPQTLHL